MDDRAERNALPVKLYASAILAVTSDIGLFLEARDSGREPSPGFGGDPGPC